MKKKITYLDLVGVHGGTEFYDADQCSALCRLGWLRPLFPKKSVRSGMEKKIRKIGLICRSVIPGADFFIFNFYSGSFLEKLILFLACLTSGKVIVIVHDLKDLNRADSREFSLEVLKRNKIQVVAHSDKVVSCILAEGLKVLQCPHFDFDRDQSLLDEAFEASSLELGNRDYDFSLVGRIKPGKGIIEFLDLLETEYRCQPPARDLKSVLIAGLPSDVATDDLFQQRLGRIRKSKTCLVKFDKGFVAGDKYREIMLRSKFSVLNYQEVYSSGSILRALCLPVLVLVSRHPAFEKFVNAEIGVFAVDAKTISQLLDWYNACEKKDLDDIFEKRRKYLLENYSIDILAKFWAEIIC